MASQSIHLDDLEGVEGSGENVDISPLCLIGKILAPKRLNRTGVANILQGAWRPRSKLLISPWADNLFLFQFDDKEDRRRVLAEAPWSVMANLLVLQPLIAGNSASDMEFKWSPFWVQVHGLPVAKMTKTNAQIIGQRIGKLIGVEALHDGLLLERSFLRIRVEVDITQPLPLGFFLQLNTSSAETDKESWVSYKYKKLAHFCYDCGRIGHDNIVCKFVSREIGLKSGYGPELWTGRAPKLEVSPEQLKHWVDEAEQRVQTLIQSRPVARRANATRDGMGASPSVPASNVAVHEAPFVPVVRESPPRPSNEQNSGRSGGSGPGVTTVMSTVCEEQVVNLSCLATSTQGKTLSAQDMARKTNPKPHLDTEGGLGPQYFVTEPTEQFNPIVEVLTVLRPAGPSLFPVV
ncbi:hypothetical protein ACSBR1_008495 [Camellia fascicularis]